MTSSSYIFDAKYIENKAMVYSDEVVYDVIRPYVVGSAANLRLGK